MDKLVSTQKDDLSSHSFLSNRPNKIRNEPTLGELFNETFGELLVLDEYQKGDSAAGNQTMVSDGRRVSGTLPERNENSSVGGGRNVCNLYSNTNGEQQQGAASVAGQGTADSFYLFTPKTSGIGRNVSTSEKDCPRQWRPQHEAGDIAGQGTADSFYLFGPRTSGDERNVSTNERDWPRQWRPHHEAGGVSGQGQAESFSLFRPETDGVDDFLRNRQIVADGGNAQMRKNTPRDEQWQQGAAYGDQLREKRRAPQGQGQIADLMRQGHPGLYNVNEARGMPLPHGSIRCENGSGVPPHTTPAGYPNNTHIGVTDHRSDRRYKQLPDLSYSDIGGQSLLSRGCEKPPSAPVKYPQQRYKNERLGDNHNNVPSLHGVEFQTRKQSGGHPAGRLHGKETRPPPYDGTGDWHDYAIQFELISELNGWDLITKGMQLATSLRGNALAVLGDLDSHKRRNYENLTDALTRRFGSKNQTELHRVELKNKQRKKGETLPELAQSVRRLSKLAYPDAKSDLQEALARDHFIDALADSDLRWGIYQTRPKCLNDAVKTAIEFETFRKAENQRNVNKGKFVRAVSGLPGDKSPEKQTEPIAENFSQVVEKMMGAIKQGFENLQKETGKAKTVDKKPAREGKSRKRDDKCYNCKEIGHFARDCPKPKPEEPATGNKVQEN